MVRVLATGKRPGRTTRRHHEWAEVLAATVAAEHMQRAA